MLSKSRMKESEMEVTRTRVRIMNSMINDLEEVYFEKMLYIAAKNSLIGLSSYYADDYFDSNVVQKRIEYALNDVIHEGVLKERDGTPVNLTKMGYIDFNYTIKGMMKNISDLFSTMGVEVKEFNITIPANSVRQVDPWNIQVTADIKYYFADKNRLASWKGFTTKTVNISVIGLYAYDYENGPKSNIGIITGEWKRDNGTQITEPTIVNKLSGSPFVFGRGICVSYCQES